MIRTYQMKTIGRLFSAAVDRADYLWTLARLSMLDSLAPLSEEPDRSGDPRGGRALAPSVLRDRFRPFRVATLSVYRRLVQLTA
jgi:hypothetical protein